MIRKPNDAMRNSQIAEQLSIFFIEIYHPPGKSYALNKLFIELVLIF